MKRVVTILLIAAFLVQCTSQVWIFIAFKINQEYIAANLCVNRFDAVPICKGSCFLEEQLDKDQEEQQKWPDLKTKEINLYFQDDTLKLPEQITYAGSRITYLTFNTAFSTSDFLLSIFRPPRHAA